MLLLCLAIRWAAALSFFKMIRNIGFIFQNQAIL
jgi:hypothetical protein